MKRILLGVLLMLIALSILAACQNNHPDDTDATTLTWSDTTSPVTTTAPITPTVTTTAPKPVTTTPPTTTTAPKPQTTVTTPRVTTTVPPPVTTQPPIVTTAGTGPVLGDNDNFPDWGPVVPMEPAPTPETLPETASPPTPETAPIE